MKWRRMACQVSEISNHLAAIVAQSEVLRCVRVGLNVIKEEALDKEFAGLDVTLVSTADWDNPYWTNKQHMAVQFSKRGQKVLYIESQGLRSPTATKRDLGRMWRRLLRGIRPPRRVDANIWVWSPLVIPFQASALIRKVNKIILDLGLRYWQARKGIGRDILWTYSPMTTELYNVERYKLVVYHAVDDIKEQPGMPRNAIEDAESVLSKRADLIFATSRRLSEVHASVNDNTHYFSNVADFDHFHMALSETTSVPADLAAIPRPRIGFIGAVSSYKIDFELVKHLASLRPEWSFVFIGEIGEGDPLTDSSALDGLQNIHLLGGRPYRDLPCYLKGIDVALQPNRLNEYTRSMFPMKFFEYLASGRPVVSVRLPALIDYADVAYFCEGVEEFQAAIEDALDCDDQSLARRIDAAKEQTYDIRTGRMMEIVRRRIGLIGEC